MLIHMWLFLVLLYILYHNAHWISHQQNTMCMSNKKKLFYATQ